MNDIDIEITDSSGRTAKTTSKKMQAVAKQLRMDGEGFTPIRTNFDQSRINEKFKGQTKSIIKSTQMRDLAERVMEERGIDIGPASVGCLLIYPNISKKRAARITKENEVSQFFSGFDYLIQISGELWDMLDGDTKEFMLYHLLMQVYSRYKPKEGYWKFNIRKPDFTDFYRINDKHGNTWYKTIQATVSSLYDLDPQSESQVRV